MVCLVLFDILQLPHTVITNSEKLTYPNGQLIQFIEWSDYKYYKGALKECWFPADKSKKKPSATSRPVPSGQFEKKILQKTKNIL